MSWTNFWQPLAKKSPRRARRPNLEALETRLLPSSTLWFPRPLDPKGLAAQSQDLTLVTPVGAAYDWGSITSVSSVPFHVSTQGSYSFSLEVTGSDDNGTFVLDEAGTVSFTFDEDGTDTSGSVSLGSYALTQQVSFNYTLSEAGGTPMSGTYQTPTPLVPITGSDPGNSTTWPSLPWYSFGWNNFNWWQFPGFSDSHPVPAAFSLTLHGNDTFSVSESVTVPYSSSGPGVNSAATFQYTYNDNGSDSFNLTEDSMTSGSAFALDSFAFNEDANDSYTLSGRGTALSTVTGSGIDADTTSSFSLDGSGNSSFSLNDDGTYDGSYHLSSFHVPSDHSLASFTLTESGSSQQAAGTAHLDSLFTLTEGALGTVAYHEDGTAGNDTATGSYGLQQTNNDQFDFQETGTVTNAPAGTGLVGDLGVDPVGHAMSLGLGVVGGKVTGTYTYEPSGSASAVADESATFSSSGVGAGVDPTALGIGAMPLSPAVTIGLAGSTVSGTFTRTETTSSGSSYQGTAHFVTSPAGSSSGSGVGPLGTALSGSDASGTLTDSQTASATLSDTETGSFAGTSAVGSFSLSVAAGPFLLSNGVYANYLSDTPAGTYVLTEASNGTVSYQETGTLHNTGAAPTFPAAGLTGSPASGSYTYATGSTTSMSNSDSGTYSAGTSPSPLTISNLNLSGSVASVLPGATVLGSASLDEQNTASFTYNEEGTYAGPSAGGSWGVGVGGSAARGAYSLSEGDGNTMTFSEESSASSATGSATVGALTIAAEGQSATASGLLAPGHVTGTYALAEQALQTFAYQEAGTYVNPSVSGMIAPGNLAAHGSAANGNYALSLQTTAKSDYSEQGRLSRPATASPSIGSVALVFGGLSASASNTLPGSSTGGTYQLTEETDQASRYDEHATDVNSTSAGLMGGSVGPLDVQLADSAGSLVPGSTVTGLFDLAEAAAATLTYAESGTYTGGSGSSGGAAVSISGVSSPLGGTVGELTFGSHASGTYTHTEDDTSSLAYRDEGNFTNTAASIVTIAGLGGYSATGLMLTLGGGTDIVSGSAGASVVTSTTTHYRESGNFTGTLGPDSVTGMWGSAGMLGTNLGLCTVTGTYTMQASGSAQADYAETGAEPSGAAVTASYSINESGNGGFNYSEAGTFDSGTTTGLLATSLGIVGSSVPSSLYLSPAGTGVTAAYRLAEDVGQNFTFHVDASNQTMTLTQDENSANSFTFDQEGTSSNGTFNQDLATLNSVGNYNYSMTATGNDPADSFNLPERSTGRYNLQETMSDSQVTYTLDETAQALYTMDEWGTTPSYTFELYEPASEYFYLHEEGDNGAVTFTYADEGSTSFHYYEQGHFDPNTSYFLIVTDLHQMNLGEMGTPSAYTFTYGEGGFTWLDFHMYYDDGHGSGWVLDHNAISEGSMYQAGSVDSAGNVSLSSFVLDEQTATGNVDFRSYTHVTNFNSTDDTSYIFTPHLHIEGSGTPGNFNFSQYTYTEASETIYNHHDDSYDPTTGHSTSYNYHSSHIQVLNDTGSGTVGQWDLQTTDSDSWDMYDSSATPQHTSGSDNPPMVETTGTFTLDFSPYYAPGFSGFYNNIYALFWYEDHFGIAWWGGWSPMGTPFYVYQPYSTSLGFKWGANPISYVNSTVHGLIASPPVFVSGLAPMINSAEVGVFYALTSAAQSGTYYW